MAFSLCLAAWTVLSGMRLLRPAPKQQKEDDLTKAVLCVKVYFKL